MSVLPGGFPGTQPCMFSTGGLCGLRVWQRLLKVRLAVSNTRTKSVGYIYIYIFYYKAIAILFTVYLKHNLKKTAV